jgi:hypothetical protein
MLKQIKSDPINDDNISINNQTHFIIQAFNNLYPSMELKCTTSKEIEQIIKYLETETSYGYEEIST